MPIKLDVVGIAVKDMAASLQFYRVLGLEIPVDSDTEPHVEVAMGGFRLAWDTIEVLTQVYDQWHEAPEGHRIELAFACEAQADVDTVYDRIVAHGYRGHKVPWDAFWGQRYAIVEDPDGNLLSLFA